MDNSLGIAITTYLQVNYVARFDRIFTRSINSLVESGFPGKIFLVDDCSPWRVGIDWTRKNHGSIEIFRRESNGGISKAKNTSLRLLLEHGCKHLFLVDDDITYKKGWWKDYVDAYECSGIEHFSGIQLSKSDIFAENECLKLRSTENPNGCFLYSTRNAVKKVGGFKILPAKYGYEHVNWSNRMIHKGFAPAHLDIDPSPIELIRDSTKFVSCEKVSESLEINADHHETLDWEDFLE